MGVAFQGFYQQGGTWGPAEADQLIENDGDLGGWPEVRGHGGELTTEAHDRSAAKMSNGRARGVKCLVCAAEGLAGHQPDAEEKGRGRHRRAADGRSVADGDRGG